MIELQDFERELDARMPPGSHIVDDYVANMLAKCAEHDGKVFVAGTGHDVAGYVTLLSRVPSDGLEDGEYEYGLISDLVVLEPYRSNGIGTALLRHAEEFAREQGIEWLRIGVLSGNRPALDLYRSLGFADRYTELEKNLGGQRSERQ